MPILITVSQTVQAYGDSLENWASPVPPFKQVYFRKENENENYAVILQKRERELMAGQIENEIKIKIARTKTRTIAVKKRGDHEFSISPATARSRHDSILRPFCRVRSYRQLPPRDVSPWPWPCLAWPGLALRTISIGLGLGLIGQCLALLILALALLVLALACLSHRGFDFACMRFTFLFYTSMSELSIVSTLQYSIFWMNNHPLFLPRVTDILG